MPLYFFPTLAPVASLASAALPLLLSAVGAIAAGTQWLRARKKRAIIIALIFSVVSVISVTSIFSLRSRLPLTQPVEKLPAQNTGQSWTQLLPRTPLSSLAFSPDHSLIIFGTLQGTLDAVSSRTGQLVFSLRLAAPVFSEPRILRDWVFVGEGMHEDTRTHLVAVRLPDGKPIWTQEFGSHLESSPAISADGKTLYGCAGEAGLYAVDASNGALRLTTPIGHCDSTPFLAGDRLFALAKTRGDSSSFIQLSAAKGRVLSTVPLEGFPWGTIQPTEGGSALIFTSGIGQLGPRLENGEKGWAHAVSPTENRLLWTQPLSGMPLLDGQIASINGKVIAIFTTKNGTLTALDGQSGTILWKHTLPSPTLSSPRRIPNTRILVALAYDGSLEQIDLESGRLLQQWRIPPESTSAPVFTESHAIFATRQGLSAFRLSEKGLLP